MSEKRYIEFMESIRRTRFGVRLLNVVDRGIVIVTAAAYGLFLLSLFFSKSDRLVVSILVPAISFLILTLIRSRINAPRPYEVFGFDPVIKKNTVGQSFPSRHVFSIFCIATVMGMVDKSLAMPMILLGVLLAILRVLGGVHFVKDVVVGAVSGVLFAMIGMWLSSFIPVVGAA